MERRMISAGFVEDALAGVRRAGLPVAPLLARAGIPDPVGASVSAEQYGALWREIARALDDEYFGMGARPMRAGSFAMLCQVILHAATLEEALKRALRFLRLVLDAPHGRLEVADGLARIVLEDDGPARSAFAYRTFWVIVHGITCWLVGRRIPLRGVDFRAPSPAHGPDYGLFFGAPVRFSQPASVLAFDAAFLKLPARRDEKALAEFLRRAPANILVRYRHDAGLAARVRAHLRAAPPTAWPGVGAIAARLRLSELTLRRRLKAEGQTYRDIKEEVRRSLALEWLGAGGRGVGEIAADLGFSEPSAFHRAFRKWTGQSPGAYRRMTSADSDPERPFSLKSGRSRNGAAGTADPGGARFRTGS